MLSILLETLRMSYGTWAGAGEFAGGDRGFGSPVAGKARFRQRATLRTQLPVSVMHLSGEFFRLVMAVAFFVFFLSHR